MRQSGAGSAHSPIPRQSISVDNICETRIRSATGPIALYMAAIASHCHLLHAIYSERAVSNPAPLKPPCVDQKKQKR
jgi:hypothetical protein